MQINPSVSPQPEVVREVPARLLAAVAEGQRVDATVIARPSADTIRVQIGDSQFQLQSRQPLLPGQTVQLERGVENGKPIIRIMAATAEPVQPTALLRQGQQLAVEVIKLLAQNRLLVSPTLSNQNPAQSADPVTLPRLPSQIEVDISQIRQTFRPGQRLTLEVLREQPLAIQLKAGVPTRAEAIQQYQRDLLPQFNRSGPTLNALNQLPAELTMPAPVRQSLTQLLQGLSERQNLLQPEGLRQALSNSGLFLENRLKHTLTQPPLTQDLKANLLQLAQQLRTVLAQPGQSRILDDPVLMQKLPTEVQTALRQLTMTPQELRNLPAQVPPALASRGQTPMQLLLSLLSGLTGHSVQTPPLASGTTPQNSNMTGVQAFLQAREMAAAPAQQSALRGAEWQVLRELLREVESASARIQFNQLSMLRDPDTPGSSNVWLFDLPIKDKQQLEMLQMRLEQHGAGHNREDETIWQVQLNLETQNLGPMQARISLHQLDVQVVLLAERQDSSELLSRHIDELNQRLDKLGVTVSHLSCRQAPIKPLTIEPEAVLPKHLLDISV
ncbi:flagellar hook-length control protein FliK [Methylophaga sp.]|uniref:flagellar hook-length control protein FliK n=1 Tax=Methylophaga sp. TaxID=2024840 RepID=UPI001400DFD9|nr:flagellar hook-length control protein FliK [Methylophaga sp.]MTI63171.1 flagellar hook-length control protein FliK [Methylophaga sp.]